MDKLFSVARDFASRPFGLTDEDGPHNATRLRAKIADLLRAHERVTVDMSGVFGLPPSFIRVVFGGLITDGFALSDLRSRLKVICKEDPSVAEQARLEIEAAAEDARAPSGYSAGAFAA